MSEEHKQLNPIPEGVLFVVTTGAYSDYYVQGVFRALKEIDTERLCREWLQTHPEQAEDFEFREGEFLTWCFRQGLFEFVESYEWHLENYSDIKTMSSYSLGVGYAVQEAIKATKD